MDSLPIRLILASALLVLPLLAFVVAGAVWLAGQSWLLGGLLAVAGCWGAAYLLIRGVLHRGGYPDEIPEDWTQRDQQALKLIEDHERLLDGLTRDQLADRTTQERIFQDLALRLAQHYHPEADDPLAPVTVAELLLAARRMIDDATAWFDYYVPGNRTLTVGAWRRFSRVPSWLGPLTLLVSRGIPLMSSGAGKLRQPDALGPATRQGMQMGALSAHRWLIRRLGLYLIELYSGRMRRHEQPTRELVASRDRESFEEVTITVIGAPGSGKSSLIRLLLGPDRAVKDRLRRAKHVIRHRVQLTRPLARLVVLEADLDGDPQDESIAWIAGHSDLLVFACDVSQQSEEMVSTLRALSDVSDGLPCIVALTHLDKIIHPPPHDWQSARWHVGQQLWAAAEPFQQRVAEFAAATVPLCCDIDEGRVHGVTEWLVPAVMRNLSAESQAHIFLVATNALEQTEVPT